MDMEGSHKLLFIGFYIRQLNCAVIRISVEGHHIFDDVFLFMYLIIVCMHKT